MKIKLPKVNNILFILLVLVYCITANDEIGGSLSIFKYLILFLCTFDSFIRAQKKVHEYLYKKEFYLLALFVIVLILYSIIKSLIASKFSFRTIQEVLFLICPMFYTFFSINTLDKSDIDKNMRCGFVIAFFSYIISLGMNFNTLISSLLNSDFGESSSDLESHIYCGFSLAFCMYFSYYGKKNLKFKLLSLLFVFMTFKRLFIVIGICLFILSFSKKRYMKIGKITLYLVILGLILLSVVYYNIMLPSNVKIIERKYNINISKLTSTRSDRLRMLENSSYKTYGFGSSTEYMYDHFDGALEMDVIKIIVELGYIPVILLIYSYMYLARSNLYNFCFMAFLILNLILSSGLTGSFSWTLFFMSIVTITKYPEKGDDDGKENKYNNSSI